MIEKMIDKVFVDIAINSSKSLLMFIEENGDNHYLVAEADCCSHSYFQRDSFVGFPGLRNENDKVKFIVKDLKGLASFEAPPTTQECDRINPYELYYRFPGMSYNITATFCLRNSSNGYYNGSVGYSDNQKSSWMIQVGDREKFESIITGQTI